MTNQYIEREAAKRELLSWAVCMNHPEYLMRDDALHIIDSFPAADVAPVRHGRWKNIAGGMIILGDCSECKVRQPVIGTNYCKNCGAKMNGGADND